MTVTALLLIDAQRHMFEPQPVYGAAELLARLQELVGRARTASVPVVFVRNGGSSGNPDQPATPGWEIHPALAPRAGETVIDKVTPDAFYQTLLAGTLAGRGVGTLVVAGMKSEHAIDTACRRAFSLGYRVILVADGHSTHPGVLPAEQIIAHHNAILSPFAEVRPAAGVTFDVAPPVTLDVEALTTADLAAIASGLAEWPAYEHWIATGEGHPFWPHSHPGRVADALAQLKDPAFRPRGRYTDPPRWEMGLSRAFYQPLENIPTAFRGAAVQSLSKAIDHLLQNPRNSLSPHMRQVGEQLWLYDARDLRLFYVPGVARDKTGTERRYVFLVWLAPGVPMRNPFA